MSQLPPHLAITSWYSPLGSTIDPVKAFAAVKAAGLTEIGFLEDHPHGLFQLWKLGQKYELSTALGLRFGDKAVYATSEVGMVDLMSAYREKYWFESPDLMPFELAPEVRFTDATSDGYRVLQATAQGRTLATLDAPGMPMSLEYAIAEASYHSIPDDIFGAHFETNVTHLPKLPGVDAEAELLKLVREGLRRRYGADVPKSHRERAANEYNVIKGKGYCSYFLVVADYVNWATRNGIRSTNRGSGAGSLTAYALGITHVEPLKFGLLFERFLNPERPSMPDFDIDFDDRRRHEVINYVRERHGEEYVAPIITRGTLHAKASMRDSARALGYETGFGSTVDRLTRMMPGAVFGREMSLAACFTPSHPRYEEAVEIRQQDQVGTEANEIMHLALQIEGATRQWGVHACGIAVSDVPLASIVSVVRNEHGETVTGFGWEDNDYLGVPKMDILGVRTLTVITDAVRMIKERHGIDIDPEQLEDGDPKTYELLAEGRTLGVFQLESPGMRRLLSRLKPTTIHDLIAMVALYRPGPMGAGTHNSFADRKNGVEEMAPLHPELADALSDALSTTYGLVVYQEDFMNLAKILAGYSLGAADNLRRAAGKKRPEVLAAEFQNFKSGCEANGISEEATHAAWAAMLPFADYGFVKCFSGETIIDSCGNPPDTFRRNSAALGTGSTFARTAKQVYERLHGRDDDILDGECKYCRDSPTLWKSSQVCNPCAAWRSKVGRVGLTVPGLVNGIVEPVLVKDIYKAGKKPLWRVTLADGRSITATREHRHLTTEGWVEVGSLSVGMLLVTHSAFIGNAQNMTPRTDHSCSTKSWALEHGYYLDQGSDGRPRTFLHGRHSTWMEFRRLRDGLPCDFCSAPQPEHRRHSVAHLDSDPLNDHPDNYAWLCVSCHHKLDYATGSRKKRWTAKRVLSPVQIVSIEYVGIEETYDLEVLSADHSWSANGGIITHNSHACAYGHIAYQTAYLKANFPVEYMSALMTSVGDNHEKLTMYLAECRWMGISIQPPDLNAAVGDFLPTSDQEIIFGISSVRAIGEGVVEAVTAERANGEFTSLGDLVRRVPKSAVNKRAWENLIRAGAFDSFGHSRLSLLNSLPNILLIAKAEEEAAAAQLPQITPSNFRMVEDGPEFTPEAKLAGEKRVLGLYITGHPLQQLWRIVAPVNPMLIKDLAEDPETGESPNGKVVKLAGIITRINRRLDKDGQPWAIITLEDLSGELDCLVFSSGFPQVAAQLEVGRLVITDSYIKMKDGSASAYVNTFFFPDAPAWRRLELSLTNQALSDFTVSQLIEMLEEEGLPELGGTGKVLLMMPGDGDELSAVELPPMTITSKMILEATRILGQESVRALL